MFERLTTLGILKHDQVQHLMTLSAVKTDDFRLQTR